MKLIKLSLSLYYSFEIFNFLKVLRLPFILKPHFEYFLSITATSATARRDLSLQKLGFIHKSAHNWQRFLSMLSRRQSAVIPSSHQPSRLSAKAFKADVPVNSDVINCPDDRKSCLSHVIYIYWQQCKKAKEIRSTQLARLLASWPCLRHCHPAPCHAPRLPTTFC